jgi:hypothetical protein
MGKRPYHRCRFSIVGVIYHHYFKLIPIYLLLTNSLQTVQQQSRLIARGDNHSIKWVHNDRVFNVFAGADKCAKLISYL